MAKLSISSVDWFDAACFGKLDQLNAWHKSGALGLKFDPAGRREVERKGPGRADIFDVVDASKRNALHVALASRQKDYALRLLELGRFAASPNASHETALQLAAGAGFAEVVDALLKAGHPINGHLKSKQTPFQTAVIQKQTAVAKLLLARGATLDPSPGSWNPLEVAVRTRAVDMAQLLLDAGVHPDMGVKDGEGATALHYLFAWMNTEDMEDPASLECQMLDALLRAGANPHARMEGGDEPCDLYRGPGSAREFVATRLAALGLERLEKEIASAPAPARARM